MNNINLKELPGIHGGQGNGQTANVNDLSTLQSSYQYKKRNVSGNHRNIISMHNQNVGAAYIHGQGSGGSNHNSLTPSKVNTSKTHILSPHGAVGGFHHGVNNLNMSAGQQHGTNNSKTPKEAYKRMHQGSIGSHQAHTESRVNNDHSSNERLNLSVDIVGRHGGATHDRHPSSGSQHQLQMNHQQLSGALGT